MLRTAAAWVRRWSGGCGAGARASNGVPRTSYGSAPSKLSVGSSASWTSTVIERLGNVGDECMQSGAARRR